MAQSSTPQTPRTEARTERSTTRKNTTPAGRSTATRSGSSARTVTNVEKKPGALAPKKKAKKTTAPKPVAAKSAPKSPAAKKPAPTQEQIERKAIRRAGKEARRRTFAEQFMPYVLVAVALFLAACFICDAIGDAKTASEHIMGYVGYYICYVLFGLFGWAAHLIPLMLCLLLVFWRKACNERLIPVKVTMAVLLTVMLSALIHVGLCNRSAVMAATVNPIDLFRAGAKMTSGGVIGGLVGFVLYAGLRLPGTIVLAIITLPLIIMCLIGVTPMYAYAKLRDAVKASRARRAEEDETEDEDIDDEAYDEADGETAPPAPRARRALRDRRGNTPTEEAASTTPSRTVTVDTETGEVLEETPAAPATEKPARKRQKATDTEVEEAEYFPPLPLHDPAPVPVEASTAAAATEAPAETPTETVSVVTAKRPRGAGDGTLAWEDFADGELAEGDAPVSPLEDDALPEDLPLGDLPHGDLPHGDPPPTDMPPAADRPVAETASGEAAGDGTGVPVTGATASGVSFEVVSGTGATATTDATPTAGRGPVEVRILKTEDGAVMVDGVDEETGDLTPDDILPPVVPAKEYQFPPMELLARNSGRYETNDAEIAENTQKLREVLESFRIGVREISCSCGPTITRFEVKPDSGIRVRSIVNLVDDISMGLAKGGVRIEAPIPGKSAVGIEVPNASPSMVYLRNILETPEFRNHKSRIAACLGADVSGRPVIFDIQAMPHLLIAGATGTGKSVCINSIIMSILYRADPKDVKLILIDPKKVEFAMYRDLPHLCVDVVSDPKKAAGALQTAVNEMERRFELIEEAGVRNLTGYNQVREKYPHLPYKPQMVIIIDELADLMMTAPAEVETAICRLAQKARAAGIHLVVGTQRPSVDVITGLIKANIPSRIAFAVSSGIDSKIILETTGAEKLIGRGDLLFSPIGANKPIRVQGAFVSDAEVEKAVKFIKENNEKCERDADLDREIDMQTAIVNAGKKRSGEQLSIDEFDGLGMATSGEDPKFWEALEVAVTKDKIGTSALQRACNLGYGRAAKIIDRMEELGFVGPDPGTKQGRKVQITAAELAEYKINGLPDKRTDDGD